MSAQIKSHEAGNAVLMTIGLVFYTCLLAVFGWQTAQFLSILYPHEDILMTVLTLIAFDGFALFWACVLTFYNFYTRKAHTLTWCGWTISFSLSLVATILYVVASRMMYIHQVENTSYVDMGYTVGVVAIVVQIVFFTFWFMAEHEARHPRRHHYLEKEPEIKQFPQGNFSATQQFPFTLEEVTEAVTGKLLAVQSQKESGKDDPLARKRKLQPPAPQKVSVAQEDTVVLKPTEQK